MMFSLSKWQGARLSWQAGALLILLGLLGDGCDLSGFVVESCCGSQIVQVAQ